MSSISQVSAAMQRILDTRAKAWERKTGFVQRGSRAVGWTGLCATLCLDLDAASPCQLFAVAPHAGQDGGFM